MDSIPGSTTRREGEWLYRLASAGPGKGVIVEIGSFLGRSTVYLARGSKAAGREKVYAIDPHLGAPVINHKFSGPTYQRFLNNLKRVQVRDVVVPVRKISQQAVNSWRRPIRLLFIDGDHAYATVKRDLISWGKFVVEGGVIAVHDAVNPGVGPPRAVMMALLTAKNFSRFGVMDSVLYCSKIKPKTVATWVNWYFFAGAMRLVERIVSSKLKRGAKQLLIKRWLKPALTWISNNL
jgi:predicted O-methyltransferase YrrM